MDSTAMNTLYLTSSGQTPRSRIAVSWGGCWPGLQSGCTTSVLQAFPSCSFLGEVQVPCYGFKLRSPGDRGRVLFHRLVVHLYLLLQSVQIYCLNRQWVNCLSFCYWSAGVFILDTSPSVVTGVATSSPIPTLPFILSMLCVFFLNNYFNCFF